MRRPGSLPDLSWIEPDMTSGHNDYHPAYGRSFIGGDLDFGFDPPSSMLGGEALLQRIYDAYRSMTGSSGTNVWNTALLIGWDEPGGTYDHVAPGPLLEPLCCSTCLANLASPLTALATESPPSWSRRGSNPARSTTRSTVTRPLSRNAAESVDLGDAFTQRDGSARTFDQVFSLDEPRSPEDWVSVGAQPVPEWTLDLAAAGGALSTLGKAIGPGLH